jgi:cytochrome c oxidase assembly protein subunit 11
MNAANRITFGKLAVVAVAMFGFGFALVPFYKKICEVTGINDLQKAGAGGNTQEDKARTFVLGLDAKLRNDLPWEFRPLERSVRVHPGQLAQVVFEVRNKSTAPVAGQAIPSYGPQLAGQYFRKLDCFCFAKQELGAGEIRRMPVTFVVHPDLPADVNTVTLSYTFFRIEGPKRPDAASAAPAARRG